MHLRGVGVAQGNTANDFVVVIEPPQPGSRRRADTLDEASEALRRLDLVVRGYPEAVFVKSGPPLAVGREPAFMKPDVGRNELRHGPDASGGALRSTGREAPGAERLWAVPMHVRGCHGRRSRYFLRAGMAWMTISPPDSSTRTTVFQQSGRGIEAQSQFSAGRVVVEGLNPQRPLCCLDRVFGRDTVLQRAPVDLHAAKWPSAARIASDLLMSFLAAAASSASSSSAVSRTATTCIGSAPRPGRPRPRRLRTSTS